MTSHPDTVFKLKRCLWVAALAGVPLGRSAHHLGPHYWLGWTVAFLLGELMVGRCSAALFSSAHSLHLPCTTCS